MHNDTVFKLFGSNDGVFWLIINRFNDYLEALDWMDDMRVHLNYQEFLIVEYYCGRRVHEIKLPLDSQGQI